MITEPYIQARAKSYLVSVVAELQNSLSPLTSPMTSETNNFSKTGIFYILPQEDPRTAATAAPLHTQLPSFSLPIPGSLSHIYFMLYLKAVVNIQVDGFKHWKKEKKKK